MSMGLYSCVSGEDMRFGQYYGMDPLTNDVHLSDSGCVMLQFFSSLLEVVNIAFDRLDAIIGCLNAVTGVNYFPAHCVQLVVAVRQVLSASHTF